MPKPDLESRLRRLRLAHMATHLQAQHTESLAQKHSYLEFLEVLVDGELAARDTKAMTKRIRTASFPVTKTLEEFDFNFQPKLDVKLIKSLATSKYIVDRENVLLVGQPGTGKTHLAIALGMKAIERGYNVRFSTIQDLAARLRSSLADSTSEERIAEFTQPDLVILDELGFTPLDRLLADAFYRIIATRYERGSIIITSNKSFESWVEVFPDAVIASAVLDRLVHHAHLVPIVGESYRMKELRSRKKGGEAQKLSA